MIYRHRGGNWWPEMRLLSHWRLLEQYSSAHRLDHLLCVTNEPGYGRGQISHRLEVHKLGQEPIKISINCEK